MEFFKRYWKWILGILLILLIGYGYWRYTKRQAFYERVKKIMEIGIFEEKTFKEIDIPTTNRIVNRTERDFYDEIVLVGLNELGVDSISVDIREITEEAKAQFDINTELRAHIIGRGDRYVIWIDDMSRYEAITVLSHELIHLLQYQSGEIILEKDFVVWKGKQYTYNEVQNIDYRERPWEKDAFSKDRQLKFKLEEALYNN